MRKIKNRIKMVICLLTASLLMISYPVYAADNMQQKEEYYKQYSKIVNRLSNETGCKIELLPMAEFTEKDWRSPEEFEKVVREFATSKFVLVGDENGTDWNMVSRSSVSASKNATKSTSDGYSYTVKISAKFNTQYSSGRQYISSVSSISSRLVSGNGTWTQTGSDYSLMDGGRTASVTVTGKATYAGASYTVRPTAEFYCSATGGIS